MIQERYGFSMLSRRLPAVLAIALLILANPSWVIAQDWAKKKLEDSPRHGEFVSARDGMLEVPCYIVYPEVKDKAPAVIVIHEIFGLTNWLRGVCDDLAARGYIAIAPDLLLGDTYESVDDARRAISALSQPQVMNDLNVVRDYVTKLPACNGQVAVAGFCWGGNQAFAYAMHQPDLKTAFVFYGLGPDNEAHAAKINGPVFGFYGENDNRINATLPATEKAMRAARKRFKPVIYPGAGHGFMRLGEAPDAQPANAKARQEAWKRWEKLLKDVF